MTIPISAGLTRLTLAAPGRRIDVALPDGVAVAALLPVLLDAVGDGLRGAADTAAGGWSVCRPDGSRLALGRSLSAQQVRDGEILHLVPRDLEWPEPKYDDVVLGIADGTDQLGGRWQPTHTRAAGLVAAAALLVTGLVVLLASGPGWFIMGSTALAVAALAGGAGVILARAFGDSQTGALIAVAGLPYALVGGLLVLGGDRHLQDLGGPQVLVSCAALLLASLAGYLGVVEMIGVFIGGIVVALLGALGAIVALLGASGGPAASVVVVVAVALMPASSLLSLRLAGMPMPELPQTPRDLLADRPVPPGEVIFTAVRRADNVLSGLLLGIALTGAAACAVLVTRGGLAGLLLAGIVSVLLLLRARTLPRLRQRATILAGGGLILVFVSLAGAARLAPTDRPIVLYGVLLPLALVAVAGGLWYSRKAPGPRLGRLADVLEIVLALSVIPVVVGAFGLYAFLRGLGG